MNERNRLKPDESGRIKHNVADLDDMDYYHRLRWVDSIRQKHDAAMNYFESLLVQSELEPETNSGKMARNVINLMTV